MSHRLHWCLQLDALVWIGACFSGHHSIPPTTLGEFVLLMFMYVYRCLIMLPLTWLLWLLYRTWTNLSMDLRENRPETLFFTSKGQASCRFSEKKTILGLLDGAATLMRGWAFRLMVSSYGCSPTLMAWTQPNYAPYTICWNRFLYRDHSYLIHPIHPNSSHGWWIPRSPATKVP